MTRYKYIAIEGGMCVGKTMFAKKLAAVLDGEPLLEDIEKNPFLEKYYENMNDLAFQNQMFFLLDRYKLQHRLHQYELFTNVILSDFMFEKDILYASLLLNDHEFELYSTVYSVLHKNIVSPDLVIYLQADTDRQIMKLKKRGRPFEKDVTPEFIKALNQKYNEFFFNYDDSRVFIVNTDNIDIDNNPEDFQDLVDKILNLKERKVYYNPISKHSIFT